MFIEQKTIGEASPQGLDSLVNYLQGLRGRKQTLGEGWPAVIEPIKQPALFEDAFPHGFPLLRRCGETLSNEHLEIFNSIKLFTAICDQFREVAKSLAQYVEAPDFPKDLFWIQSEVKKGQEHFVKWHVDGDIEVGEAGRIVGPNDALKVLVSGEDFRPRHIFLQAATTLPTVFASKISGQFDRSLVVTRRIGRSCQYEFDQDEMGRWTQGNAEIAQSMPGNIIAFPAGVQHTGCAADIDCKRTVIVARLTLKSPAILGGFLFSCVVIPL